MYPKATMLRCCSRRSNGGLCNGIVYISMRGRARDTIQTTWDMEYETWGEYLLIQGLNDGCDEDLQCTECLHRILATFFFNQCQSFCSSHLLTHPSFHVNFEVNHDHNKVMV